MRLGLAERDLGRPKDRLRAPSERDAHGSQGRQKGSPLQRWRAWRPLPVACAGTMRPMPAWPKRAHPAGIEALAGCLGSESVCLWVQNPSSGLVCLLR